jgi:hypothetical protein
VVIIEADLCAPPSEVALFRDITLFSHCFLKKNVVIECERNQRDFYYKWLKDKSSWDYVYDMITPCTENGITIRKSSARIVIPRIDYTNFTRVINSLQVNARN